MKIEITPAMIMSAIIIVIFAVWMYFDIVNDKSAFQLGIDIIAITGNALFIAFDVFGQRKKK